METLKIVRKETSVLGTFGEIKLPDGTRFATGELPWRGNRPKVSCIPAGVYRCEFGPSARGRVYHVTRVPDRGGILIHVGNWCGEAPDWKSDTQGCILLGERVGLLEKQRAVRNSSVAIAHFHRVMAQQEFLLEIVWAPGVQWENTKG